MVKKTKKEKSESLSKVKNLVIGFNRVIKLLKQGKIKKIILAKDLEQELKTEIKSIAKLVKVEIEESKKTRAELAEELKKPFAIGTIGY